MEEASFYSTSGLISHPETPSLLIQGISVQVGMRHDGGLMLTYTLTGNCARLRIPSLRPPLRVAGLWQHTCFEAFVRVEGSSTYQEFNFSPSSEWAVYHLRGYRDRLSQEDREGAPRIVTHLTEGQLELDAHVRLPTDIAEQPLRLGLSAVIEDQQGQLSYWALYHPPGKPDFHHPDTFQLAIVSS